MIDSYYDGSDVLTADNGSSEYLRISPSSVSKFFSFPRSWWGENLLDEPGFTGSTSSHLGTIVHFFAEQAASGTPLPRPAEDIVEEYLLTLPSDIDRDDIRTHWRDMSSILINSCVQGTTFHSIEQFIYHKILPGVYAAGTYDALRPTGNGNYTLRDYKTASQKPSVFSSDYRMQLHTYAYILSKRGITVDYIELCYTVRPTKTLPARYFHFVEPVTPDDLAKIESQLLTIAHSYKLWMSHPEYRFAIAQDIRLKPPEKPLLFKD